MDLMPARRGKPLASALRTDCQEAPAGDLPLSEARPSVSPDLSIVFDDLHGSGLSRSSLCDPVADRRT